MLSAALPGGRMEPRPRLHDAINGSDCLFATGANLDRAALDGPRPARSMAPAGGRRSMSYRFLGLL